MLLTAGGGNSFKNLWNSPGPVNDPNGNKSSSDFQSLLTGEDFKVEMDPNWGDPVSVSTPYLYNRFDFYC